jgi:hypothetical protein
MRIVDPSTARAARRLAEKRQACCFDRLIKRGKHAGYVDGCQRAVGAARAAVARGASFRCRPLVSPVIAGDQRSAHSIALECAGMPARDALSQAAALLFPTALVEPRQRHGRAVDGANP